MKKYIFLSLIVVQIVVIFFLAYSLIDKSNNILGTSINVIKKETIDFPNSHTSYLKNYYEPKSNQQQKNYEEWLDFIPIYTINRDTFNDSHEYTVSNESKSFRIITIGDSFTFGQYVNTKDNWTELLEEELNWKCKQKHYEVINLGVHGSCIFGI